MYTASYEELVKLVKEHGTFEASEEEGIDGVLSIDLTGTGFSEKYNRLEVVLKELYPEHEPCFDMNDLYPEDGKIKIWLADKNWRDKWFNPLASQKEYYEQKALAHIKETAEVILYGDTSLPDAEKDAVCKVSFNLSDYSDCPVITLDDREASELFFYDVTRYQQDTDFIWGDGYTYTADGIVHVVLLSKALYEKKWREFCESF